MASQDTDVSNPVGAVMPRNAENAASVAVDTVTGFDPYRAWLNVREVRRPLNAYQLLGLSAGEDDVHEIRNAASLNRATLEAHRDEAPEEVWRQLHKELEQATGILLDPDKKLAYDLSLNRPVEGPGIHPMSPGAVTRDNRGTTLNCHHCGTANPAGRRFCGHCGKNLWEACIQCSTVSPVGERYCGACGADMWATVRELLKRIESELKDVTRLRRESRFDEAISLLGAASKLDHPALAVRAAEARKLIKEVARERDEGLAAAEEAFATARQHFEQHDYGSAVEVLCRVAEPLRNESMQELLHEAQRTRDELDALDGELREALRAKKQTGELLAIVERLLAVQPDHAEARQVAQVIGQRLSAAAEERLKRFKYDEALAMLRRVPRSTRTPQVERLNDRAAELARLVRDLQKAPAVTPSLLEMARRLHKLAPDDPRPGKVLAELERRVQIVRTEVRRTALPWAAAPEETHLGLPVDWLTGFQRVVLAEGTDRSRLIEMPGRFAVAFGLALQGAGRGAVKTSLMPRDHGTMLTRVSRIIRKRPTRTAWGLDLSATGLKAVKLTEDTSKRRVVFEKCAFIGHRKVLSQAVNEIEERQMVDETLKAFLEAHPLQGERVVVGVPGRLVLNRQLQLPPTEPKTLARAVEYEAGHHIPHPMSQLVWDYQLLDQMHGGQPAEARREVFLMAAKREAIERQLARFERVNLPVDRVQVDTVALYNFFAFEFFPPPAKNGPPPDSRRVTALLDVGHDSSSLVIAGPQLVWFRNFGLAGHSFTRALGQQFRVTLAHAEEIKRDPLVEQRIGSVYAALDPVSDELVGEIRRSVESFHKSYPNHRVVRLMGVGGGLQLHGLLRYLQIGR